MRWCSVLGSSVLGLAGNASLRSTLPRNSQTIQIGAYRPLGTPGTGLFLGSGSFGTKVPRPEQSRHIGPVPGHVSGVTKTRSVARKVWSLAVTSLVLVGGSAFLIDARLDAAPGGDRVGRGPYTIEHVGPAPDIWLSGTRDSKCWDAKPAERAFTRATNASRQRVGRGTLSLDPELSKAARKHTREMTDSNLLHHTTEDALRRRVTFWNLLGENVGVGNTVDTLHKAFMDSPTHRDNIVYSTFRHIGVGTRSAHGRLWVTVLFESREDPGTTLRMPRCGR